MSWTSVDRNGTRTTGAGATALGQAGEVVLLARRHELEVGQVAVEAAEVGAREGGGPLRRRLGQALAEGRGACGSR